MSRAPPKETPQPRTKPSPALGVKRGADIKQQKDTERRGHTSGGSAYITPARTVKSSAVATEQVAGQPSSAEIERMRLLTVQYQNMMEPSSAISGNAYSALAGTSTHTTATGQPRFRTLSHIDSASASQQSSPDRAFNMSGSIENGGSFQDDTNILSTYSPLRSVVKEIHDKLLSEKTKMWEAERRKHQEESRSLQMEMQKLSEDNKRLQEQLIGANLRFQENSEQDSQPDTERVYAERLQDLEVEFESRVEKERQHNKKLSMQLEAQIQELDGLNRTLQGQIAEKKQREMQLRKERDELFASIVEIQPTLRQLTFTNESLETELHVLQEANANLQKELRTAKTNERDAQERLELLQTQYDAEKSAMREITSGRSEVIAEATRHIAELQHELDAMKRTLHKTQQSNSDITANTEDLLDENRRLQKRCEDLSNETEGLQTERDIAIDERKKMAELMKSHQTELNELFMEAQEAKDQMLKEMDLLEEERKALEEEKRQIQSINSKHSTITLLPTNERQRSRLPVGQINTMISEQVDELTTPIKRPGDVNILSPGWEPFSPPISAATLMDPTALQKQVNKTIDTICKDLNGNEDIDVDDLMQCILKLKAEHEAGMLHKEQQNQQQKRSPQMVSISRQSSTVSLSSDRNPSNQPLPPSPTSHLHTAHLHTAHLRDAPLFPAAAAPSSSPSSSSFSVPTAERNEFLKDEGTREKKASHGPVQISSKRSGSILQGDQWVPLV